MKTHYIRAFPSTAREQIDAILALSEVTRGNCIDLIGDLNVMVPAACSALEPFLDAGVEGRADDDTTIGADVRRKLIALSKRLREIRDELATIHRPAVTALEAQIDEQREIESRLRKATDDMLGLPTLPALSPEAEARIVEIAQQLRARSAGDEGPTIADQANASRDFQQITHRRVAGGAAG